MRELSILSLYIYSMFKLSGYFIHTYILWESEYYLVSNLLSLGLRRIQDSDQH